MSNNPSGGWLVLHHPCYYEETTFGVFPTNPAMNWIGACDSWDPSSEIPPINIRQLGSEDSAYLLHGQENYSFTLSHYMQTSAFSKYAVNSQGGGAGSIDKSLSIAAALQMDPTGGGAGTAEYYTMTGCRPRSITFTGKPGEAIKCSTELLCQAIAVASSTPIGSGSWGSDPGTAPYIFTSGGLNPITIGGSAFPITDITATVNRNPEAIFVMGASQAQYIPPKSREVTASLTVLWLNTNLYTDLTGYTDESIVWTFNAASPGPLSTLTLGGCKFHKLDSFTVKPTDVLYEKWSVTGKTAALV